MVPWFRPAVPLEQGQFHGGPLQHRDGHHSHRRFGTSGEDSWYPDLLPGGVNLTDVHRVKEPWSERNLFTTGFTSPRLPGSALEQTQPYEIVEVHPEEAVLGALGAELPLQGRRPVGPVV